MPFAKRRLQDMHRINQFQFFLNIQGTLFQPVSDSKSLTLTRFSFQTLDIELTKINPVPNRS